MGGLLGGPKGMLPPPPLSIFFFFFGGGGAGPPAPPSSYAYVQSIVSLTGSLRGQLVKYFTTLILNTLKFFVEKMREAFAQQQKLLTLFQQKYWQNLNINV